MFHRNVPTEMVEELSVPILKKADKFRESINTLCSRIEKYTSQINTRYTLLLEAQALELKQHLGLDEDELVNPNQTYNNPSLEKLHKSFSIWRRLIRGSENDATCIGGSERRKNTGMDFWATL